MITYIFLPFGHSCLIYDANTWQYLGKVTLKPDGEIVEEKEIGVEEFPVNDAVKKISTNTDPHWL